MNKVDLAGAKGEKVPFGWGLDEEGNAASTEVFAGNDPPSIAARIEESGLNPERSAISEKQGPKERDVIGVGLATAGLD